MAALHRVTDCAELPAVIDVDAWARASSNGRLSVGRARGHLRLDAKSVPLLCNRISRSHCSMHVEGSDLVLEDHGSTNGTFYALPDEEENVQRARARAPVRLPPGSTIFFGGEATISPEPAEGAAGAAGAAAGGNGSGGSGGGNAGSGGGAARLVPNPAVYMYVNAAAAALDVDAPTPMAARAEEEPRMLSGDGDDGSGGGLDDGDVDPLPSGLFSSDDAADEAPPPLAAAALAPPAAAAAAAPPLVESPPDAVAWTGGELGALDAHMGAGTGGAHGVAPRAGAAGAAGANSTRWRIAHEGVSSL
jgi:hypothetical protein